LAEFENARLNILPKALRHIESSSQDLPPLVELRGIYRYTHVLDSPALWNKQRDAAEKAREQVLAGDDFATVAGNVSQGKSRVDGGMLGRRYLDPAEETDSILAVLKPGAVSPVVETDNGFWFYRIEAVQTEQSLSVDHIAWPARRILLRKILANSMQPQSTGK